MQDLVYVRTDKNGTKIYHDYNCPRCGGAGWSDTWRFTGCTCFACGGSGKRNTPHVVKIYTPEYEKKLDAKRKAREQAKAAVENQPEILLAAKAIQLADWGFAADGSGYVYYGKTYAMRTQFRRAHAQFNGWIRAWIAPAEVEAIAGVKCIAVNASDLLVWRDGCYNANPEAMDELSDRIN